MKLFVKLFVWFALAIILSFGSMNLITRTFQTEPMFSRWQSNAKNSLGFYGSTAEQIFTKGGENDLRNWLTRLGKTGSIREADLVDDSGNLIVGEGTSLDDFDEVIARTRASNEAEIDVNSTEPALGAMPVTLGDGRRAMLLVRWAPPRAPSLFFDSWVGYTRLAGLVLTALLLSFLLALYLTSPIRKLRVATQQLAGGDLRARVSERIGRRRDELADLARDFDVMAERVETLIVSQQRLNRDISHELRSPLARMNVALEIAKKKANPETTPVLERIETESTRLNEMIGRLLTLAKLESGADDVERVRVDLTELVRDVAADADYEAHANGKYVEVTTIEPVSVIGSENLLRSAIENVLRNAVRYTKEGTAVDVSLSRNNGNAVLKISDHGGGVPEDEIENLFRPFYRVGEARERKTGGTGLGLAIADRAIKAHKGQIIARNFNGGLQVEIDLKTTK